MPGRHFYSKLHTIIVNLILDECADGDPLPSMRVLAEKHGANPLTVAKAYQPLIARGIIRPAAGIGLFVAPGGVAKLRQHERIRFLTETWPALHKEASLLGIDLDDLARDALSQSAHATAVTLA
ncbi:MAG: GntR family transcriptional regulator [Allosphingosinicella sp.]|uniref:GntR family transcriptional regulator n=1 Tax=Allosphingosinicella sp. TaxID=2823234 RepID=UPI003955BD09